MIMLIGDDGDDDNDDNNTITNGNSPISNPQLKALNSAFDHLFLLHSTWAFDKIVSSTY